MNDEKLKNWRIQNLIYFLLGCILTFVFIKIFFPFHSLKNTHSMEKIYEKTSLSSSIEKIYDAVVTVETYKEDEVNSSASGFIYKIDNKDAYILTNEHVIKDFDKIIITFSNNEEISAELLEKDEFLDLAVLKISSKKVLLVAPIGDSENINIGDTKK